MFRFIAFAWNTQDPRQVETAQFLKARVKGVVPELQLALEVPGLLVYAGSVRPGSFERYAIGRHGGVVLGRLFPRHVDAESVPAPVSLEGPAGGLVLSSRGRALLDDHWGQYVAFVHDAQDRASYVIRDPSGGIGCHVTAYQGLNVFFSNIQDCLCLGVTNFSINWQYVIARMILPLLQVQETGLEQVSSLAAGGCWIVRSGQPLRSEIYWDPVRISQTGPIEDLDTASRMARTTIQACVGAWASGYPRILHKLSGGLDSSIVLACLRKAPSRPHVTCLNYYERSIWADERRYARLAIQGTYGADACQLVECERRAEDVQLRSMMDVVPSASPRAYLTSHEQRRLDIPVAARESAALFTGTHGDGLFFTKRAFAAMDYFHRHGFGPHLLRIAHATALSEGIPVWKVVPQAIRSGWRARHQSYDPTAELERARGSLFASAEAMSAFERTADHYLSRPWLQHGHRMAPGKVRHLKGMYLPTSATNPLERAEDPDWIMPLASQPLVELFLRIPSYVLTSGGQNRSVARRAFAGDLPPEILNRHSKGCGNHLLLGIFRHNEPLYREVLLDGVLVREGLLDRRKVETFFSTVQDPGVRGLVELLQFHFNLEIWLRSWVHAARNAVGAAAA